MNNAEKTLVDEIKRTLNAYESSVQEGSFASRAFDRSRGADQAFQALAEKVLSLVQTQGHDNTCDELKRVCSATARIGDLYDDAQHLGGALRTAIVVPAKAPGINPFVGKGFTV